MRIDELEQETSDIDWFATDSSGYIIHFASGGGSLPESVASSQEILLQLYQYFLALPDTASASQVQAEPNVAKGADYQSFIRYARRGLFSFEKASLSNLADPVYSLVARPVVPLTIKNIPEPIATLVRRTTLSDSVLDKMQLLVTDIV